MQTYNFLQYMKNNTYIIHIFKLINALNKTWVLTSVLVVGWQVVHWAVVVGASPRGAHGQRTLTPLTFVDVLHLHVVMDPEVRGL